MADENPDLVADAAAALIAAVAAAEALIAVPDTVATGFITGTGTESRPPWNAAAANAVMDTHAGVRDLEARVRFEVSGTVISRGGSDANTTAAIGALVGLSGALSAENAAHVARSMDRWAESAMALPGVDRPPVWMVIRLPGGMATPPCPWCATPNLRLNEPYAAIACLYRPCPVMTIDGHRPWAQVGRTPAGGVCWTWPDGSVQP